MSTALAKGIGGVGFLVSVSHLIESSLDLVSDRPRFLEGVPTWPSSRQNDGVLGVLSSGFSVFQSVAVFSGRYGAARTLSVFAIGISALQLLFGGVTYFNKEPGYNGSELLLPGLQMLFLVSGLSYSWFSLPALALRARGGDGQALTKIFMRWHEHKDPAAAREISKIAVQNPYLFAANHSTVLFSGAVDEASARIVLNRLIHDRAFASDSARLVGVAIKNRPALFQERDINRLFIEKLRLLCNGPHLLDRLVTSRPDLAETVINEAPAAFSGRDWEIFGNSLRVIWARVGLEKRAEVVRSWEASLRVGWQNEVMRPIRDLFRLLEKDRYEEFVDSYVRKRVSGMAASGGLRRLATPVLEDVMNSGRSGMASIEGFVEEIGERLLRRKDVDIGAFDFLWHQDYLKDSAAESLRKEVLRLVSKIGGQPSVVGDSLVLVVHGEQRTWGQPGLFAGWFDDGRRLLIYQEDLLDLLREGHHRSNPVLQAVASYHHLGVS